MAKYSIPNKRKLHKSRGKKRSRTKVKAAHRGISQRQLAKLSRKGKIR